MVVENWGINDSDGNSPTFSSQSDSLQVKSPILVKQTDWCYILGSPEPQNLIKWNFMLETIPIFLFIVVGVFLIILLILWFLLPFAIFGTKDKLNDLINETKKTNDQLEKLRALFVTRIKLQKDSKSLTKESKSED